MSQIAVIEQREVLGKVFKVYGTIDNPLFLAKDVAIWIEHSNSTEMLRTIDEYEKLNSTILSAGQNREVTFLTEDGLYEVLFQSRKPIAKEFKKQVKEILKSIRKNGMYINQNPYEDPDKVVELAIKYRDEFRKRVSLESQLKEITSQQGTTSNIPQITSNNTLLRSGRRTSYVRDEKRASIQKAVDMYINNKEYKVSEIIQMCGISETTLYRNINKLNIQSQRS